jgi:hypothetical protein
MDDSSGAQFLFQFASEGGDELVQCPAVGQLFPSPAVVEDFVRQATPVDELQLIRDSLQHGQLTGTNRFIDEVEGIVGLRIEQRGQGRPRVEHDK